jgi:hypothetical protein
MSQDYQHWIGLKYVNDVDCLHDDCLDDSQILHQSQLPQGSRVVGPETMVTMDYNPDRLNVHIDHDCTVVRVHIG